MQRCALVFHASWRHKCNALKRSLHAHLNNELQKQVECQFVNNIKSQQCYQIDHNLDFARFLNLSLVARDRSLAWCAWFSISTAIYVQRKHEHMIRSFENPKPIRWLNFTVCTCTHRIYALHDLIECSAKCTRNSDTKIESRARTRPPDYRIYIQIMNGMN